MHESLLVQKAIIFWEKSLNKNEKILGLVLVVNTKMEQMMCTSGYTDQFTGLVTSMFMTCGTLACIPVTIVLSKMITPDATINGKDKLMLSNPKLNYAKCSVTLGTVAIISLLFLAQIPDQKVKIENFLLQMN